MRKGIGNIIVRLREETGCTQNKLCEGICSKSQLARIEQNQIVPDVFLLDMMFGRMGKSAERLEYVLSSGVYRMYELRYQIQKEILYRNLEKAEAYLRIYEEKQKAVQPLHRQFIEQERAQILWMRGEKTEKILRQLNAAITETMPLYGAVEKKILLSAEELKLLLFRWEVCRGTVYERKLREVCEILEYMERRSYDAEELLKVYPYAVLLLVKNVERKKKSVIEYFLKITGKALELLRNGAGILFLPEILELYSELLELTEAQEEVCEFQKMRETLLKIETEFGVHYENYPLFQHSNRAFELDYEVLQSSRLARKLSQEKLCEDICTQEALSRMEKGKCAPSNRNLKLLLDKMQRSRERIGMNVVTDRYEVLVLEKQIACAEYKGDNKKANDLINKMQEKLDMSITENKQYIQTERLYVRLQNGKIGYEEGIEKLYDILHMTLMEDNENIFLYCLTERECNILNQIAIQYCQHNQIEKGIELWKKLLKNYERKTIHVVFNIRNWELVVGNIAGRMEEIGQTEKAISFCKQRLQIALEAGKGNQIGRSLAIIACALERKRDKRCIARFHQALEMYRLMKLDYRYQCTKEYMEKMDKSRFL